MIFAWLSFWFEGMVRAALQGGLALTAAWMVCRLLPTVPSKGQCWLWRIAYLKLLLALFWTLSVPLPILPTPPETVASPDLTLPSTHSIDGQEWNRTSSEAQPVSTGAFVMIGLWAAWATGALVSFGWIIGDIQKRNAIKGPLQENRGGIGSL